MRAVDFLKSEVAVGRISLSRLQSLASILGVASAVGGLDSQDFQDGADRQRFESDVWGGLGPAP